MYRKFIFLLAAITLPAAAGAASVAVFDGAMQNGWTTGNFSIVQAPSQPAGVMALNAQTDGWKSISGRNDIAQNTCLEFDIYFDTSGQYSGTTFAKIQESWDSGAPVYEMKDDPAFPVWWLDDVQQSTSGFQYSFTADTWRSFKLDLQSTTSGTFPTADGMSGFICGNWAPVGDMYLMNIRFTPEPATMALFALGGLAVIRRQNP